MALGRWPGWGLRGTGTQQGAGSGRWAQAGAAQGMRSRWVLAGSPESSQVSPSFLGEPLSSQSLGSAQRGENYSPFYEGA